MRAPGANSQSVRGRSRDETRAHILAAAERIFAESGLAGARTEAIAARARVNKALLYYYFRSKEELHLAVLRERMGELRERGLAAISSARSVQAKVEGFVNAQFDFFSVRRYYPRLVQRVLMAGGRALADLRREQLAPLYQKLAEVIEEGVRRGELRAMDSHHAVLSLVALTVHYFAVAPIIKQVAGRDPYEESNLALRRREVLEIVRHGFFRSADPPTPRLRRARGAPQ